MKASVTIAADLFVVRTDYWDNERAKSAPDRKWDPKSKCWLMPMNGPNAEYLKSAFTTLEVDVDAQAVIDRAIADAGVKQHKMTIDYQYDPDLPPMDHQVEAVAAAYGQPGFAFFMEMGCGKTFTSIHLACIYFLESKIDRVLVICPTSIKGVWKREFDKFCTVPYALHVMESGKPIYFPKHGRMLKVLVVGIEALSQGKGYSRALDFAQTGRMDGRTLMVADESSTIKNPMAKRTEAVIALGAECSYRLALTGTPVTQGMQDLFAQFRYLDWAIIGQKNFFTFRNRYCVMGGFEQRSIIGYSNVPELMDKVRPYVYSVSKEDVMDLPPKVFQSRLVQPSPGQKKALLELKHLMITEQEGETLEVETVLERMTRYQQISGGHFPFQDEFGNNKITPIAGKNPKMEELKLLLEEISGPVIIWARFIPEILLIQEMLLTHPEFGQQGVTIYSGLDPSLAGREESETGFQEGRYRFFISNQQTGSKGITLTEAHTVIYYSNTFSYEDRVQSEDRAHRKGLTHSVTYVDLVLDHQTDRMITIALAKKTSMAQFVKQEIANGRVFD